MISRKSGLAALISRSVRRAFLTRSLSGSLATNWASDMTANRHGIVATSASTTGSATLGAAGASTDGGTLATRPSMRISLV